MSVRLQLRDLRGLFAICVLAIALLLVSYRLMAVAVERNLRHDAESDSLNWALYFTGNFKEIEEIAAGGTPSVKTLDRIRKAAEIGDVFRFKLFDRFGFLRFVSDDPYIARGRLPSLASHNPTAAQVLETGKPFTQLREGNPPERPAYFTETYLPIVRDGETIAIAEVYVDQTDRQAMFQEHLLSAGLLTALLAAVAFGIPAAAYFYRSKQKRRADRELKQQNETLNYVLENMSQGFCMFDADKRLVLANSQYLDLYKVSGELALPGTPLKKILEQRVAVGVYGGDDPEGYIRQRMERVEKAEPGRDIHELPDGRVLLLEHKPLPNGGWLATHDDITEFRNIEKRIDYLAHFDAVTGAENRASLEEKIARRIGSESGGKFALLCVDLDHFKTVNEAIGHRLGDALLNAISERLRDCAAEADTVARIGGDEFAVLQMSGDQPNAARVLAQRICEVLQKPFEIEGQEIATGASIGIAISPTDGRDAEELIKSGELALTRAKEDGRGMFHFYEMEMQTRMRIRRQLERDLRDALKNGELELYYQPLMDAASGAICGCEALVRWDHPERGAVPPGEFIPLAEEIGVIVPLGEWVIREACREAAGWPEPLRIAVNVSAAQFGSGNLVNTIVSALSSAGLEATRLELEITETTLLQDNRSTLDTLHMLRDLGVRIAMDDFGTGYSSLSYLRSFPFDKIKLDGTFVRDAANHKDGGAIVRAVGSLGTSLGITTTAEGVETKGQAEMVRAEGYSEIQGYYYSPPRPAAEIREKFFPLRARAARAAGVA